MKDLPLNVLASASIKRRKPWPSVVFMGKVHESLILLDTTRASVLYVPSGKTKKRIQKLQQHLSNTTVLTTSRNGGYLVGLLSSGDLFIWHKDTDSLRQIRGIPILELASDKDAKPDCEAKRVWVSDDGDKLVVWCAPTTLFVWERDTLSQPVRGSTQLPGTWSHIETVGQNCLFSMVFHQDNLFYVTTVILKWFDAQDVYSYRMPIYTAQWLSWCQPWSSIIPMMTPAPDQADLSCTYVPQFSNDGRVLAVAVNTLNTHTSSMLYVSPWTGIMVSANMKGLGARDPVQGDISRSYWVCDVNWTPDDLHLCVVTQQGYLALLTRMGEPLLISSHGNSVDIGMRFFLPIHPRITVQSSNVKTSSQVKKLAMQQLYSISVHPRKPIIILSDGYNVTVLERPPGMTCLSLIASNVSDAAQLMHRVNDHNPGTMSLFDSARSRNKDKQSWKSSQRTKLYAGNMLGHKYQSSDNSEGFHFEKPCKEALEDSYDGPGGPVIDVMDGKIVFGDVDNMNKTTDFERLEGDDISTDVENMSGAMKSLMTAWGLAVSHSGVWTGEHEDSVTLLTRHITRLSALILHAGENTVRLLTRQKNQEKITKKKRWCLALSLVLNMFGRMFQLLEMDGLQRNLQVIATGLVHSLLELLLSDNHVDGMVSGVSRQQACYSLLHYADMMVTKIYASLPSEALSNNNPYGFSHIVTNPDLHSVSVPCKLVKYNATDLKPETHGSRDTKTFLKHMEVTSNSRFQKSWLILYQNTIDLYKKMLKACLDHQMPAQKQKSMRLNFKKMLGLVFALQCRLHSHGAWELSVKKLKKHSVTGDVPYIEGMSPQAINAWLLCAEKCTERGAGSHLMSRLLHGALYALLLQRDLVGVMELVTLLIHQPDPRKSAVLWRQQQKTNSSVLQLLQEVPCKDRSEPRAILTSCVARHVVLSLARIMAAYFSNMPLFVFPPHAACRLPSLFNPSLISGRRVLPLYRETLSTVIRQAQLSEVWTAERALHYLMVAGSVGEGVWFLKALGDWKAAFILAVACFRHAEISPHIYKRKSKLWLPDELQPVSILKDQLQCLLHGSNEHNGKLPAITAQTDMDRLTNTMYKFMNVVAVARIDIVPWLLGELMTRLKSVSRRFSVMVPAGLYLPAPPIYCPQPAADAKPSQVSEVQEEEALRQEASSLILLINTVLLACNAAHPAASWYAQRVFAAFNTNLKTFKKKSVQPVEIDIEVLHESYLTMPSIFEDHENEASTQAVLSCLRDLCTISWMLHVRDELSLSLREKSSIASMAAAKRAKAESDYKKHFKNSLKWTRQLIPFSGFLTDPEGDLLCTFLSLISELPSNQETAKILAEHCYSRSRLDPLVQEKLDGILCEWKSVFLTESGREAVADDELLDSAASLPSQSPRGVSLSVYYHAKAKTINKLFNKRVKVFGSFEEFCFDPLKNDDSGLDAVINVGSRSCEGSQEYVQFLDTFYAVSFERAVNGTKGKQHDFTPLFGNFCQELSRRELNMIRNKSQSKPKQTLSPGLEKSHAVINIESPRRAQISPRRNINRQISSPSSKPPSKKIGLFRSKSLTDIHGSAHKISLPASMPPSKSSSQDDLAAAASVRKSSPSIKRKLSIGSAGDTSTKSQTVPPLSEPVIPPWKLDNMLFPNKFNDLELELEYLNLWAQKKLTFFPTNDDDIKKNSPKPTMKLRVSPKLTMYSLWLLENCHYKEEVVVPPQEVTVGMVHTTQMETEHSSSLFCCSPRRRGQRRSNEAPTANPNAKDVHPTTNRSFTANVPNSAKKKKKKKRISEDSVSKQSDVAEHASPDKENKNSYYLTEEPLVQVQLVEQLQAVAPAESVVKQETTVPPEGSVISARSEETPRPLKLEDLSRKSPSPDPAVDEAEENMSVYTLTKTESMNTLQQLPAVQSHVRPLTTSLAGSQNGLAAELQGIVRQEMRRIMEAQQRGILAMIGALDDPNDTIPASDLSHTAVKIPSQQHKEHVNVNDDPIKSVQQEMAALNLDKGDVSTNGLPLTMSELTNKSSDDQPWTPEPVNAAIDELRLLERNHNVHPVSNDRSVKHEVSEDKENYHRHHNIPMFQPSNQQPYSNGPQRYSSLMNALQEMNRDLLQYAPHASSQPDREPPRLLDHPSHSAEHQFIIPLSEFTPGQPPRPAWMQSSQTPGTFPDIPLLHLNNTSTTRPRDFISHEPPERDTNSLPGMTGSQQIQSTDEFYIPFPMLRIPEEGAPVNDMASGINSGTFHRTFPDEVQAYHQKQLEKDEKNRHELDRELAAALDHKLQELQKSHSKSSEKRKKRRKEKKQKEGRKVRLEPKPHHHDDDTDVAVESLPERDQDTLAETTDRLMGSSEQHPPSSKATSTSSKPSKSSKTKKRVPKVEELHSGYALTPGMFDEYLEREPEAAADTSASIQYRTATEIKPKPTRVLMKDMFTETEPTADDKTTATSKDSGTDPVHEALQKHYRSHTQQPGSILPPDVFLGLQFGQLSSQQTAQGKDGAPAFINVVDLQSDVISEITGRGHSSPTRGKTAAAGKQAVSFRPQRQPADEHYDEAEEEQRRPDQLTSTLLASQQQTDSSVLDPSSVTRGNRYKTKSDIRRRLQDMNDQFNAIAAMQENIERDFKSSNLLLNTVEQLGEAMLAERTEPTAKVLDHFDDGKERDDLAASSETLKQDDYDEQSPHAPKISQESPRHRTPRADKDKSNDELVGLSGVSEILGEMIERGEIDAEQAGLSQLQTQLLINRARDSARSGVNLSNDQLEKIFKDYSTGRTPRSAVKRRQERTAEEQKELKHWMAQRRGVQQKEYSQKLKELRAHEKQPYKSSQHTDTTQIQESIKTRGDRKKSLLHEFEEKRRLEASQLMGDLLSETLDLPSEQSPRDRAMPRPDSQKTFSARKTSPSPTRKQKPVIPRKVSRMTYRSPDRLAWTSPARERPLSDRADHAPSENKTQRSVKKTPSRVRIAATETDDKENIDEKPYKPRPYTDLVRLQRPEATKPRQVILPLEQHVRGTSQSSGQSPRQMSAKSKQEKQKVTGSERLAGTYKLSERTAPRVVKTYTERLQEMRQNRKPVQPHARRFAYDKADSRVMRGGRLTEVRPSLKSHKPPHQALTYSQQLQQLQPPKEIYKSIPTSVPKPTMRKWHGPANKPKTYAQQLQELQPRDDGRIYRSPHKITHHRTRPYGDPYAAVPSDDLSVLSSWSVESQVQKLVYDQEPSHLESGAEMTDLDMSELHDLADLEFDNADYSQVVDIREIAEAASVSGSSIMSFIDWDQVDQLIAEA